MPIEIQLARLDAEPGGFRKGVMVAVEALAKGHQPEPRQVVSLHRNIVDAPA